MLAKKPSDGPQPRVASIIREIGKYPEERQFGNLARVSEQSYAKAGGGGEMIEALLLRSASSYHCS